MDRLQLPLGSSGMQTTSLFVTRGTLSIRVMEVADLSDLISPRKPSLLSRFRGRSERDSMRSMKLYAKVSIVDREDSRILSSYSTAIKECNNNPRALRC